MWDRPISKTLEVAMGMLISMSLIVLWVMQIEQFTNVTMKLHYGEYTKSIDQTVIDLSNGITSNESLFLSSPLFRGDSSNTQTSTYSSSIVATSGAELLSTCLFKEMTGAEGFDKEYLLTSFGLLPLKSTETWKYINRDKVYYAALAIRESSLVGLSHSIYEIVIWQSR